MSAKYDFYMKNQFLQEFLWFFRVFGLKLEFLWWKLDKNHDFKVIFGWKYQFSAWNWLIEWKTEFSAGIFLIFVIFKGFSLKKKFFVVFFWQFYKFFSHFQKKNGVEWNFTEKWVEKWTFLQELLWFSVFSVKNSNFPVFKWN